MTTKKQHGILKKVWIYEKKYNRFKNWRNDLHNEKCNSNETIAKKAEISIFIWFIVLHGIRFVSRRWEAKKLELVMVCFLSCALFERHWKRMRSLCKSHYFELDHFIVRQFMNFAHSLILFIVSCFTDPNESSLFFGFWCSRYN